MCIVITKSGSPSIGKQDDTIKSSDTEQQSLQLLPQHLHWTVTKNLEAVPVLMTLILEDDGVCEECGGCFKDDSKCA